MTNAERREKIQDEAKKVISAIQEGEQQLARLRAYLERLGGKLDLLTEQDEEANTTVPDAPPEKE